MSEKPGAKSTDSATPNSTAYPARQTFGRTSVVHAVTAARIPGGSGWGPDEPLCGTLADLEPSLPGLFTEPVTCTRCQAVADREGITIGDDQ